MAGSGGLVGGDRRTAPLPDRGQTLDVLGQYRLLDELEIEILELLDEPHGHPGRPALVGVDPDLHAIPDGGPHRSDALDLLARILDPDLDVQRSKAIGGGRS